jgi:hypothetical protein
MQTHNPTPTYTDHIIDLITSYDPVSCIDYDPIIIDELDQYHLIPSRR